MYVVEALLENREEMLLSVDHEQMTDDIVQIIISLWINSFGTDTALKMSFIHATYTTV